MVASKLALAADSAIAAFAHCTSDAPSTLIAELVATLRACLLKRPVRIQRTRVVKLSRAPTVTDSLQFQQLAQITRTEPVRQRAPAHQHLGHLQNTPQNVPSAERLQT